MASLHEKILTEGLREGNVKIFDYLFHFYYSGLVLLSFRLVGDKDVAEDIVQDFFLRLWANRKNLVIKQSIKSYFFTSIKNKSLDFLKRKKKRARELYMEEFRISTLMRMGKLTEYLMKYNPSVIQNGFTLDDHLNKLPIPNSEIEANKDVVLEQNEGY